MCENVSLRTSTNSKQFKNDFLLRTYLFGILTDPRHEWSIFSGPGFQTLPSWLLIGLKNVARGKLWQNPRDELQNTELYQTPAKALHEAPCEALQKLYQKLYQRLCNASTHPVRRAVQGGLPLEALLEALLKALYGALKLY